MDEKLYQQEQTGVTLNEVMNQVYVSLAIFKNYCILCSMLILTNTHLLAVRAITCMVFPKSIKTMLVFLTMYKTMFHVFREITEQKAPP